jgi:hypothetical protein
MLSRVLDELTRLGPLRAFCLRCALTNSCGEPTKELNCNHGVLISDRHFDAFLKCRTKAHFTFSSVYASEEPTYRPRSKRDEVEE